MNTDMSQEIQRPTRIEYFEELIRLLRIPLRHAENALRLERDGEHNAADKAARLAGVEASSLGPKVYRDRPPPAIFALPVAAPTDDLADIRETLRLIDSGVIEGRDMVARLPRGMTIIEARKMVDRADMPMLAIGADGALHLAPDAKMRFPYINGVDLAEPGSESTAARREYASVKEFIEAFPMNLFPTKREWIWSGETPAGLLAKEWLATQLPFIAAGRRIFAKHAAPMFDRRKLEWIFSDGVRVRRHSLRGVAMWNGTPNDIGPDPLVRPCPACGCTEESESTAIDVCVACGVYLADLKDGTWAQKIRERSRHHVVKSWVHFNHDKPKEYHAMLRLLDEVHAPGVTRLTREQYVAIEAMPRFAPRIIECSISDGALVFSVESA